jgi:hypothetical protein
MKFPKSTFLKILIACGGFINSRYFVKILIKLNNFQIMISFFTTRFFLNEKLNFCPHIAESVQYRQNFLEKPFRDIGPPSVSGIKQLLKNLL